MKDNNIKDISNSKLESNKINNDNNKNNNETGQIKYFHFNEVKKIVNNKNKKVLITNKKEDKLKNQNKSKNLRKEEEDSYRKNIYQKKLIITHYVSTSNLIRYKYYLYQNEKNNNMNLKIWNSTDERYKTINKFGLITKKILHPYKCKKHNRRNISIPTKNCKFSKNNKFKSNNKSKSKLINNQHNIIDIHDINNINNSNFIYDFNNINEFNNTMTSNTITSKTITNNTMTNNTISNLSPNCYINNKKNNKNLNKHSKIVKNLSKTKEFKEPKKPNKNNNIKIMKNKGRNKNNKNIIKSLKNKYSNDKDKENTIFIRRIILEEKFTIDSKGDKKTIYIKEISPIFKSSDIVNSGDKRLIKKNKINKNNNDNFNNKDNTFINHNDINLNFNVCSFQKINFNNNNINKKNILNKKLENFNDEYKINLNNDKNINESIFQNYKDFLKIKSCQKIIYQKPNRILNKSEKNHKSYQSLFSSPNKAYFMKIKENDLEKKNIKINQKIIINNLNNNKLNQNFKNEINNNKSNQIKKNLTKENNPSNHLKHIKSHPRFLKNKLVHRKVKTNINNNENENINEYINNPEDEESNPFLQKRSLSFVGKVKVFNLVKKAKDNKKLEIKDKIKNNNININNSPSNNTAIKNYANKPKEFLSFTPMLSGKNSKNNTRINSNNNSKLIKIKEKDKKNLHINGNDISNNITRCHSLNKKGFNSNEIKEFISYLKNNKNINSGRNKSHRNFLIKKEEKYLDNILNKNIKNKNNINKKGNYPNIIYKKSKPKEN